MGDADTASIQKLIKQVIEATRCSAAQAELALYDNDNNIYAAAEHILDKGRDIESWTEHKNKKDKKKDEDERKSRGYSSSRGRGVAPDRGGRGVVADRSANERGTSVSSPRGGPMRGGESSRGGRGQSTVSRPRESGRPQQRPGVLKPRDLNEDSLNWKGGSLEFKRSDIVASVAPSSCNGPSAPIASNTPSISFAAVAAAAARKEQQKNQPPPAPVAQSTPVAEPPREPTPEPTAIESFSNESVNDTNNFTHEPSITSSHMDHLENTVPVIQEEPVNVASVHNVQPPSPELQTAAAWTTQLKSDLGIASTISEADVSPVKAPQFAPTNTRPGVEFATETVPIGLVDYHFGFVEPAPAPPVPAAPVPTRAPSVESSSQSAESLFTTVRHSSPTVAPVKTTSEIHLGNGEYPVKANSPPVPSAALSQTRLGFAEASTVSYNPSSTAMDTRTQHIPKSHGHMTTTQSQAHQQQQQHHQQQQQQQQQAMFPAQMPFSYANPYMYSPINSNLRPEDYSALLQQYPFSMPGMDMANLMGGVGFPQPTGSQGLSNQHRSDSHGMDNTMKFAAQSNREQTQQPSAVQPPPGFGTPFGMQPQMNMLQQHYNPQQYPQFMMPNMGSAGGRQMYGQDEERKSYDKMGGVKMQTTQPPQYHNNGHYGMSNNKKYNWNS